MKIIKETKNKTQWEIKLEVEHLKHTDFKKYCEMRSKYENELFEKRDVCFCGKLLTGFHGQNCNRFITAVNKRILNNWSKFEKE